MERDATLTITTGDGEEKTFENVTVQPMDDAKERASEVRENAPEREYLTDGRVSDIDDVIAALQDAKERGVERVQVNDDGQSRGMRPVVTNNHIGYHAFRPEPPELREWVEL